MAIAFSCPTCGRGYKVKDELSGKSVTCKQCTESIRVPAPVAAPAMPDEQAESAAVEVLAEIAAADAQAPPEELEFECPNCIEKVKVDVKFAGKQAPCPNCKRIVRVPRLSDAAARNWRAANHLPTLAKADDKELHGQWGNTTSTSIVSRDALAEANALRKRRPKPGPSKVKVVGFTGGILLAIGIGLLLWRGHSTTRHRDDFMQRALAADDVNSSPVVATAVRRAAGEYNLRAREPNLNEANKMLRAARDRLAAAAPGNTDKTLERLLLLTDIAVTQSQLGGNAEQVQAGRRLAWSEVQPELRRTLTSLVAADSNADGIAFTFERLAATLGAGGDKDPIAPALIATVFAAPQERVEPLAIYALEQAKQGSEGRERAAALAVQIRSFGGPATPKVIALHVLLEQMSQLPSVRPPADGEPPIDVRLGFAEGLARRGEIDAAQRIARLPGRFEDRFAAEVQLAAALEPAAANPSIAFAVDLLMKELGARDLPDWPLIRLARTCSRAGSPAAATVFNFLQSQANLSPRSQAVRAWAQYELLRGAAPAVPLTEEALLAMTPGHTAGAALAWEALGRHRGATGDAPSSADAASEPMRTRALALAGIALGLLDHSK